MRPARHRWGAAALCAALAACGPAGMIGNPPGTEHDASVDGSTSIIDAPSSSTDAARADASIPDAAPDARPACTAGDANVEDPDTGRCYMYFADLATWEAARLACAVLDAHLVVSTSQAENDVFSPLAGQLDVWVGGNDIEVEGSWGWLNGEPLVYSNWRDGEPNNGNGGNEDCMIIEGDNGGLWDDRPCDRAYSFICER